MTPETLERLERICAAGIELIADVQITTHYVFARDGFAALVEKRDGAFGNIGTPGLVTEQGFAALLWRDGEAFFSGRGFTLPAAADQVEAIRAFDRDLNAALR